VPKQDRASSDRLRILLGSLQQTYHQKTYLSSDPLEFVHRFEDPWDQETVALLAGLLAYGNVKQIRRSVEDALSRISSVSASPRAFVQSLGSPNGVKPAQQAFQGFVHRFNVGADLVLLFSVLARSWREHGSLGAHFVSKLDPRSQDVGDALNDLMLDWRSWAKTAYPGSGRVAKGSFGYLLTAPQDGSCCKRWCMFLRWMGRKDELDPGLWTQGGALSHTFENGRWLKPSQLVIPLDTHTGRISQYLALTRRKSLGWLAALEVTDSLKVCDPEDPVRYDFALARLGILDLCQRKYQKHICERCQLLPACRFARKHAHESDDSVDAL
jgi:uncharacterized protein (TIGR02757 family)